MCEDCGRLHEQLQEQAGIMFALRRRITRLRSQLKDERREKEKILKEQNKNNKQHLRKGQKRGHHGRNG